MTKEGRVTRSYYHNNRENKQKMSIPLTQFKSIHCTEGLKRDPEIGPEG